MEESCPYSQKIVRKRLRSGMCWQRWDSLEDRKPFYLGSVCQEIGSGKGEINTAETLSTVKTAGETAVRMGRVQGRGRGMAKHTLL